MRFGNLQLEWWHLLLIATFVVMAVWFIAGLLVKVRGTWERIDEDVTKGKVERITLVQFGPFVRGRRMMKGGFQQFNGILRGRSITMTRRDHGRQMIIDQGFPASIADEIDGTVTAGMRLTLSADGKVLHGTFSPQKIEFTHQPPEITSRRFLEPSFRRYSLISRDPMETEVVESRSDKPKAFRKTV